MEIARDTLTLKHANTLLTRLLKSTLIIRPNLPRTALQIRDTTPSITMPSDTMPLERIEATRFHAPTLYSTLLPLARTTNAQTQDSITIASDTD